MAEAQLGDEIALLWCPRVCEPFSSQGLSQGSASLDLGNLLRSLPSELVYSMVF